MKNEWRIYWRETLKSTRSVPLALGVSLIIWLFQLPDLPKDQYFIHLVISCVYGLTIFSYIWTLYALAYAFVTHIGIKTGKIIKLNWGIHLPLSFLGTAIGLVTGRWFEALILKQPFSTSEMLESLMVGSFISLMFMFYYAYKHSAEENLALKAAKAETELLVLKNQMQPHFLFNSLNSLAELIETNKDSASDMAMKLSDLYREILENSKKQLAPLSSEISIIQKYLELEKIRFGDRLVFSIEIPNNSDRISFPSLVLQTLVENAVKHGVASAIAGGQIQVSVNRHNSQGYQIKVMNTLAQTSKSKGSGTGLENTKARLSLLYGDKHQFALKIMGQKVEASFWFSGEAVNG